MKGLITEELLESDVNEYSDIDGEQQPIEEISIKKKKYTKTPSHIKAAKNRGKRKEQKISRRLNRK